MTLTEFQNPDFPVGSRVKVVPHDCPSPLACAYARVMGKVGVVQDPGEKTLSYRKMHTEAGNWPNKKDTDLTVTVEFPGEESLHICGPDVLKVVEDA